MITDDLKITRPDYWNQIYQGRNNDAPVDASNTKRPANSFDRFSWVAQYAEGWRILGVASGHAHIEKRIKAAHPDWYVVASDQASGAIGVSKYQPYWIVDAYKLPFVDALSLGHSGIWDTLIIAQAMEYLERPEEFMKQAAIVSNKILITLPIGEMPKWSQLRIYTEENVRSFLDPFGTIEVWERAGDLLLIKLKFVK